MNEKYLLLDDPLLAHDHPNTVVSARSVKPSRRRRLLRIFLLTCAFWILVRGVFIAHHYICSGKVPGFQHPHAPLRWETTSDSYDDSNSNLVPLEIHIMSKCPDAKDCLQKLVVPVMEKVHDKVNFTMSFIGRLDPDSDAVTCMHGPGECLGNIILLCATKLYPEPKIHLGYANCMLSDYKDIPERDLVEGCAMEHGIDFGKLNSCISDEGEGQGMLRRSVERSQDDGVTKSCTVRVDGKVRCIRDGGKWSDCDGGSQVEDLVRDIRNLYLERKED